MRRELKTRLGRLAVAVMLGLVALVAAPTAAQAATCPWFLVGGNDNLTAFDCGGHDVAWAQLTHIPGTHGFRIDIRDDRCDNVGPSVTVYVTDGRQITYPQVGGCGHENLIDKYYPIAYWRLNWGGVSSGWQFFLS